MTLLADELAERVIQKLVERQKRALVIVTGAAIGVPAALEQLKALRSEGFTYHVLMSRSAMHVTGEKAVRDALEPEELWVESADQPPEKVAAGFQTILVPALTVNTAAHLAGCMSDTPAAAMILSGLLKGKNVVVAVDGACPDNPMRAKLGYHMTPALRDALHGNLEKLQAYGARLTAAEDMAKAVRKAVTSFLPAKAAEKREAPTKSQGHQTRSGNVIRHDRQSAQCESVEHRPPGRGYRCAERRHRHRPGLRRGPQAGRDHSNRIVRKGGAKCI